MAIAGLWSRLTRLDRWIVAVLLAVCLAGLLWPRTAAVGTWLVAERDGTMIFRARLATDQTIRLTGPLGVTELMLQNGRARVVASPCRDKVCIGMGAIDSAGELLACVPNRLLITIPGPQADSEAGYDLLSR